MDAEGLGENLLAQKPSALRAGVGVGGGEAVRGGEGGSEEEIRVLFLCA